MLGPSESGTFENNVIFTAAMQQCRGYYGGAATLTGCLRTTYAYTEEFFRE